MVKALLFDLDGTLLPISMDKFLEQYLKRLGAFFAHLVEPKLLISELLSATEGMIKNPGELTNEDVFMKRFLPALEQEKEVMYPLFEKFYLEEFPKLKEHAGYSPLAERIVGQALEKGYKLGLATNPVFPRLATEHRMEWAGIKNFSWEIVTSYENSYSCKPNTAYYQGLCDRLGINPQECMMIGNDVQEDMVASRIGISTYLVTDCLIDRREPSYQPDYTGTLAELEHFIEKLPSIA